MNNKFTDVESWTVDDLIDCFRNDPVKKRKIKIPTYQRNLVWNDNQKKMLIDSIKNGMPIGALLLFNAGPEGDYNIYHLIDGLQRSTTIKSYFDNPNQFFSIDNLNENFLDVVYFKIKIKKPDFSKEYIGKLIVEWIKKLKGFSEIDGFSSSSLTAFLDEKLDEIFNKDDIKEMSNNILPPFLKEISDESNIRNHKVPIIIYSGDKSNLPTIFERLNSKGTQLSKYQIYAATWTTYKPIEIENIKIIDKVKNKYDSLIEEGFEIENYEPMNFYKSKFNYFEYFFGLGKYLSENYPLLFNGADEKDQTESIGFNIGCICINHNLKQMDTLPDKLKNININKYENAILDAVGIANEILKPYIGIKANKKKGKTAQICHTEMQIVSIIGKLFREKYDEKFEEKASWKDREISLRRNIPYHYLYDILRNYWSGTGDTKANELINSNRYEIELSKENWENVLNEWQSQEKEKKEKSRSNISVISILFLKYIYTHIYSAHNELSTMEYEVDHIIPISRLKKVANDINGLPLSNIGNLCIIEKSINREKSDKTLYEFYDKQVKDEEMTIDQSDKEINDLERYTFTKRDNLEFIENLNKECIDKYYNFIDNRYGKLKNLFYEKNSIH